MSSGLESFLDLSPQPWRAPELADSGAPQPSVAGGEGIAQQAITAARAEAAELIRAARAEAEQIRLNARDAGLAEAAATLVHEREQLAAQLTAAREEINGERERFFREAEPELLKLAIAIAEKVIGREVSEHPDIVLDHIRKSVKRIKDKSELRIRVNPDDLQLVKEGRAELLASVDGVEKVEVTDDRRVGRGGCVIESPNGTLDGRIATQLRELERTIAKVASHDPEHDR